MELAMNGKFSNNVEQMHIYGIQTLGTFSFVVSAVTAT